MLLERESPPFEILNAQGCAPVLIACDHASNLIPAYLGNLGLCDDQLETHIAWDIGAKQVAGELAVLFDAPLIAGGFSRLVIDLNRHLDDPTLIVEQSDHIPVPGNRNLGHADRQRRIQWLYDPYHKYYNDMVGHMIRKHPYLFIISVHSFTPRMNGFDRPWHFGVLHEKEDALAEQLLTAFAKLPDRIIGDNEPYHVNHPRGYAYEAHAKAWGANMAMLEIRQDLISRRQDQIDIARVVYEVTHGAIREYLNS